MWGVLLTEMGGAESQEYEARKGGQSGLHAIPQRSALWEG